MVSEIHGKQDAASVLAFQRPTVSAAPKDTLLKTAVCGSVMLRYAPVIRQCATGTDDVTLMLLLLLLLLQLLMMMIICLIGLITTLCS